MNPIAASRNTANHPFKAWLAYMFGKRTYSGRYSDKMYVVARLFGKDYLVGTAKK